MVCNSDSLLCTEVRRQRSKRRPAHCTHSGIPLKSKGLHIGAHSDSTGVHHLIESTMQLLIHTMKPEGGSDLISAKFSIKSC